MGEPRGDLDFPAKTIGARGGDQLGLQNLDGDAAAVLAVPCQVDHSHAPAPQLTLDSIPVTDGPFEALPQVAHAFKAAR
jgi:hypothetical protein